MKAQTVVTITGIRPDFIRMSRVFDLLDRSRFNHVLIHSGQHFETMLSDIFFEDLHIRQPDYNLAIGGRGKEHWQQIGEISEAVIHLFRRFEIHPDLVLFLGDSNSAAVSMVLKKEGYEISHIEAGMRSHDKRMLEEINRTVCDHCSTYHFVYHDDYASNLMCENLPSENIYNVGNTIVEVCRPLAESLFQKKKLENYILLDIHRPENFRDRNRLQKILDFAIDSKRVFGLPVYMLKFGRTLQHCENFGIDLSGFKLLDLMSYKDFLRKQYNSLFMISDSGTAQEEPALLNTPVIVPREFTERPQSMSNGCSFLLSCLEQDPLVAWDWVDDYIHYSAPHSSEWLGNGHTAEKIVETLEKVL